MSLDVYLRDQKVGTYKRSEEGGDIFTYLPKIVEEDRFPPISLSLPKREEPYRGTTVERAFLHLLPDSPEDREKLAADEHLEDASPYSLLSEYGQDCIGALRFLPEGVAHEKIKKFEPLQEEDIAEIIQSLKYHPVPRVGDRKIRLSLAGTQEKTALTWDLEEEQWCWPEGEAPSTHIFKPPMKDERFFDSHINEYASMKFFSALGASVPKVELLEFEGRYETVTALCIQRFDRQEIERGIIRLHQEDFCRALGRADKYERTDPEGNPKERLAHICLDLLNMTDDRHQEQLKFIQGLILQWILAATDGHAKNYGIFLEEQKIRMTPFYDVMSGEPYNRNNPLSDKDALTIGSSQGWASGKRPFHLDQDLAMSLGAPPKTKINEVKPQDFINLAEVKGCRLAASDIYEIMENTFKRIPAGIKILREDTRLRKFGKRKQRIIDPMIEGIEKRRSVLNDFL